jgi:hypothetical protein
VLATITEPFGEDIILKVFQEIESNPEWRRCYDSLSNDLSNDLSDDLTCDIINQWIGKYVSSETGMKSIGDEPAGRRCSLINYYSILRR